jgi:hypothetical protein
MIMPRVLSAVHLTSGVCSYVQAPNGVGSETGVGDAPIFVKPVTFFVSPMMGVLVARPGMTYCP